jgi:LmbE family N-acetylglucosaminyl deacetylase
MRELGFSPDRTRAFRVLCLGAHCDDIEIGCGGTILTMARDIPNLDIHWVVFSSNPEREHEARLSAQAFLAKATNKTVVIHRLRDGFFPYLGAEIKEHFEQLKGEITPDVILTHYRTDLHQDHRIISDLTWNTFRDHLIFEYEIPKYDGDFGSPNLFISLEEEVRQQKIQYLLEFFQTQREKPWFSADLFSSMLRLRGMEANAPTRYAEAFYVRKMRLTVKDGESSQVV